MTIKRTNKAPLILPVEDHRKATQFVGLLFAVGQRVGATRKSKGKTIKKDERVRETIRGPYFLMKLFYHRVINFAHYKEIITQLRSLSFLVIIFPDKDLTLPNQLFL